MFEGETVEIDGNNGHDQQGDTLCDKMRAIKTQNIQNIRLPFL